MKFKITSEFGELSEVRDHVHHGVDIGVKRGTELHAIGDGIVNRILDLGKENLGKGVELKLENGQKVIYGHMSDIDVKPGQVIHEGEYIGLSGNTGHSTGDHLHLAIKSPKGEWIDPTAAADRVFEERGMFQKAQDYGMDRYNDLADWFVGKEVEYIVKPVSEGFHDLMIGTWKWFVYNLPDFMGFATIGAGAFIIIGSMLGKGSMLKTIAVYSGMLIVATLIRMG
jgi:murein DD-endopeptidase MepM/ murein hydrolase activator NlpD